MTMAIQSTIAQIQSAASAAQQSTAAPKNNTADLGESDFLTLLTTQLQYQDPTQPMDSTAFVAQLAQFSALEQMTNVNTTLTSMLTAQSTALQTTAADFLGHTAVFNTDQVSLQQGQPATITADLSAAAANVNITIQDQNGDTVRTLAEGPAAAGVDTFTWDGNDDNGNSLASGTYTVQIAATDSNGNAISLTQSGSAQITAVSYDSSGTPTFIAGGTSVSLSEISQIDE
jgi:flagellar basal-body rod modification protein FlgD